MSLLLACALFCLESKAFADTAPPAGSATGITLGTVGINAPLQNAVAEAIPLPMGQLVVPVRFSASSFDDCLDKLGEKLGQIGGQVVGPAGGAIEQTCRRHFPDSGSVGGDVGSCQVPTPCQAGNTPPPAGTACTEIAEVQTNVTRADCHQVCVNRGAAASQCHWTPGAVSGNTAAQSSCSITLRQANGMMEGSQHPGVSDSECNRLCQQAREAGSDVVACQYTPPRTGPKQSTCEIDVRQANGLVEGSVQSGVGDGQCNALCQQERDAGHDVVRCQYVPGTN